MNTPNTKTGAFAPPPVYPMPSYLIEQAIAGVGALNISEEKQQALIDAITEAAMGLTLRDRFAIEAMPFFFNSKCLVYSTAAKETYKAADAMLEARKQ